MPLHVPPIVSEYVAAERESDAKRLSRLFAEDGFVRDEGRVHRGREAIRRWKERVDAKYRYVSEPLAAPANGNTTILRCRLTGDFPGSPVELDQTFELRGDTILSLEIHS
jgi:hypothetical protein